MGSFLVYEGARERTCGRVAIHLRYSHGVQNLVSIRSWLKKTYSEMLFRTGLVSISRRRWPLILHYHRIDPVAFDRQMEYLTRWGRAISLDRALACLAGEESPVPGAVVVTFDDGYRSLYDDIRPVLARHDVPATVYLVSDATERGGALWFDLVEWAIWGWKGEYGDLVPESLREAVIPGDARGTRRRALRLLRRFSLDERERCVEGILTQAGLALNEVPDRYRLVSWEQARTMRKEGLITLGGHTRTHPILTRVSQERAWDEIVGSKARIEEMLGCAVTHFAYPNGQEGDFDDGIAAMVAEAGYRSAVTTIAARLGPGNDRFALPRWGIDDRDTLATFAVKIAGLWPVGAICRRVR